MVSKVEGGKNALRLTCCCLKQAVDATTTRLTWRGARGSRPGSLGYMESITTKLTRQGRPGSLKATDLTEALGGISCPALTHLSCKHLCSLISLAGCPPGLQHLDCSRTWLSSLAGCPPGLQRLDCSHNEVESLAGCPPSLRRLNCNH